MMTATDTRKKAREALAGKWGKGALIALVYAIFSSILSTISGKLEEGSAMALIISLAIAIIEIPISYGLIISFIKLKRGEEVGYFDFFKDGFNNFGRAWGLVGNTILKMVAPVILLIVSIIIMGASFGFSAAGVLAGSTSSSLPAIAILGIVVYIAALIYTIVRGLLYSLSNYIAYDNSEMSTKEAVEKSSKLMNGNRGSLFLLELSIMGLLILGIIILYAIVLNFKDFASGIFWGFFGMGALSIACLFVIPYMQVAIVCFYEQLSGKDTSTDEVVSSENK